MQKGGIITFGMLNVLLIIVFMWLAMAGMGTEVLTVINPFDSFNLIGLFLFEVFTLLIPEPI